MEFIQRNITSFVDWVFQDQNDPTLIITQHLCLLCDSVCFKKCDCRCHFSSCATCDRKNCVFKICKCYCHNNNNNINENIISSIMDVMNINSLSEIKEEFKEDTITDIIQVKEVKEKPKPYLQTLMTQIKNQNKDSAKKLTSFRKQSITSNTSSNTSLYTKNGPGIKFKKKIKSNIFSQLSNGKEILKNENSDKTLGTHKSNIFNKIRSASSNSAFKELIVKEINNKNSDLPMSLSPIKPSLNNNKNDNSFDLNNSEIYHSNPNDINNSVIEHEKNF